MPNVYYCACKEYILITNSQLSLRPRRKTDNSFILSRQSSKNDNNSSGGDEFILNILRTDNVNDGKSNEPVHLIRRPDGLLEKRRVLQCPYCMIPVGYRLLPSAELDGDKRTAGDVVYLYDRALTAQQHHYPKQWTQQQ